MARVLLPAVTRWIICWMLLSVTWAAPYHGPDLSVLRKDAPEAASLTASDELAQKLTQNLAQAEQGEQGSSGGAENAESGRVSRVANGGRALPPTKRLGSAPDAASSQTGQGAGSATSSSESEKKAQQELERVNLVMKVTTKRERLVQLSLKKKELNAGLEKDREQLRLHLKDLHSIQDSGEQEVEITRQHRANLESVGSVLKPLDSNLGSLEKDQTAAREQLVKSQKQYEDLTKKLGELQEGLKNLDLEAWLRDSPNLSPMMREALKLTEKTVNPAVSRLSNIKANLDQDPNSLGSFVSSILIYLTVLFPVAVVLSLSLQLKRTLTNVTVRHVVFLGALYFGIVSAVCTFASLSLWRDALSAAHDHHPIAFDLFMVVHTILYLSLTVGQMRICFESSALALELAQAAALITVGIHFSWALPGKLVDAGANTSSAVIAYIVYAFCLLLVAFEKDKALPTSMFKASLQKLRRRRFKQGTPPVANKNGPTKVVLRS